MPLGRDTRVAEVHECPGPLSRGTGRCCAKRREVGRAEKGAFEKKCRAKGLKVMVGDREIAPRQQQETPPQPAAVQRLEGHMARRKRHAALAEYGEPFGDIGFFGDLLDTRDLKDFGVVAASGLVTAAAAPKIISLIDKLPGVAQFVPVKALPYVKGLTGVLGGFAVYKYAGRKVPAKYRDAVVAAAAVLAGFGLSTLGHELFDTSSMGLKLKELHGLGDLFPVSLANVGGDELALLAALSAVEDQGLAADMDPTFGDVFTQDAFDASVTPDQLEADVDPEWSWTQGQLDASVEPEDAFLYDETDGEVDLDALAMMSA